MVIRTIIASLFVAVLTAFAIDDNAYRYVVNNSFTNGELLKYRVHLGFINAGFATMRIEDKLYEINSRTCYRIDVFGQTSGVVELFQDVEDNWGTYLDTASIIPLRAYRYIKENRYRKNEVIDFKPASDTAIVFKLDKQTKELKETLYYAIPNNAQDIVSGYYYLRTLDFNIIPRGKVIKVDAFFDEEVYDFQVKYLGKDVVKTKFGKFNAIVLSPVMPKNKIFRGKNPIKVWLSDDRNKIPIKVKAAMFVGAVEIDIIDYENVKHPLNIITD